MEDIFVNKHLFIEVMQRLLFLIYQTKPCIRNNVIITNTSITNASATTTKYPPRILGWEWLRQNTWSASLVTCVKLMWKWGLTWVIQNRENFKQLGSIIQGNGEIDEDVNQCTRTRLDEIKARIWNFVW